MTEISIFICVIIVMVIINIPIFYRINRRISYLEDEVRRLKDGEVR